MSKTSSSCQVTIYPVSLPVDGMQACHYVAPSMLAKLAGFVHAAFVVAMGRYMDQLVAMQSS